MNLQDQQFGIEMEMTGLSRKDAAQALSDYYGGTEIRYMDGYKSYRVKDDQSRTWKVVNDCSIREHRNGRPTTDTNYAVEVVSPICKYPDIPHIMRIADLLCQRGAISSPEVGCGIHVHIDASPFDARMLRNLANIMYCKEDLIYKALQVDVDRERRYCKKVDEQFIQELNRSKPSSKQALQDIWYGSSNPSYLSARGSRYHCLNLHAVFDKGTVEFRLFNGTLDPDKLRAYIQLSLAITAQALNQSNASRQKTETTNEKYTFRTWLLRLGLIGPEFSETRRVLLEHLEGNVAWRDPQQAEQQKERIRQRQSAEQEQQEEASGMTMAY